MDWVKHSIVVPSCRAESVAALAMQSLAGMVYRSLRPLADIEQPAGVPGAGLVMGGLWVLYGVVAIAMKLAGLPFVTVYASLLVAITFLSGVQLTVTGMVGQCVAPIYDEVRARPLRLVAVIPAGIAGTSQSAAPDSLGGGQQVRLS